MLDQHLAQRAAARETAPALAQRDVDVLPRLSRGFRNRPHAPVRPAAGAGVAGVGPTQDLFDGQHGTVRARPHVALAREQPGQRQIAGQATNSLAEGTVLPDINELFRKGRVSFATPSGELAFKREQAAASDLKELV